MNNLRKKTFNLNDLDKSIEKTKKTVVYSSDADSDYFEKTYASILEDLKYADGVSFSDFPSFIKNYVYKSSAVLVVSILFSVMYLFIDFSLIGLIFLLFFNIVIFSTVYYYYQMGKSRSYRKFTGEIIFLDILNVDISLKTKRNYIVTIFNDESEKSLSFETEYKGRLLEGMEITITMPNDATLYTDDEYGIMIEPVIDLKINSKDSEILESVKENEITLNEFLDEK